MSDQHPSVEDEIDRALRLGLATAGQLADRYARARHDIARQVQHRSEQEAHQLQARYRAEGGSAVARLAVLDRQEWWDRATPEQITGMWELAVQWRNEQPRAAAAAETIARQVQDRYGIDLNAAPTSQVAESHDVGAAVAAVVRAEQRDAGAARAAEEDSSGSRSGTETKVYDSFERREEAAAALQNAELPAEAVEVAMRADVAHGRPAADAATVRAMTSRVASTRAAAPKMPRLDRSR